MERKSKINLLPYAASLLLPLSLLNTSEVNAQGGANSTENHFRSLGIGSNPIKSIVTIMGMITDENNEPVANAEVFVLETGKSVRTKPNGTYKIVCTSGSTLFSTKNGLESRHVVLGTRDAIIDLKLEAIEIPIRVCSTETTILTAGGIIVEVEDIETIEEETIEGEIEIELNGDGNGDNGQPIEAEKGDVIISEENKIVELLRGMVGLVVVNEPTRSDNEIDQIIISGIVGNEKGAIPGVVFVQVKGSENKTSTDFDGNYKIGVKPNTTLVFSSLGYVSREIRVSNISNAINIQLKEEVLEEPMVMVLGRMIVNPDKKQANRKSRSGKKKK